VVGLRAVQLKRPADLDDISSTGQFADLARQHAPLYDCALRAQNYNFEPP